MKITRWIAGFVSAISIVACAGIYYTYSIAPRWLQVRRLRIGLPGLPEAWRGVRIAHLSDFHVGQARVPISLLARARAEALSFEPDIVALTGDYYDDGKQRDSYGLFDGWPENRTFAVLGNHDYRGGKANVLKVKRELSAGGARVLGNEAVAIDLRGQMAWIAAVDDPYTGMDDVRASLSGVPLGESALLMLAHSPSVAVALPTGAVRLVLCGHTHGGQIRVLPSGRTPFLWLIHWLLREPRRTESTIHHGQHWVRGAVVNISNGLGVSQLPLRLRTRPQVVLIELGEVRESNEPCDGVKRYVDDETREPRWARWLA